MTGAGRSSAHSYSFGGDLNGVFQVFNVAVDADDGFSLRCLYDRSVGMVVD